MEKIVDIELVNEIPLLDIIDEYIEDMKAIPKEEGKTYFKNWSGKVDPKLIRQSIFAGMLYALKHPEKLRLKTQNI